VNLTCFSIHSRDHCDNHQSPAPQSTTSKGTAQGGQQKKKPSRKQLRVMAGQLCHAVNAPADKLTEKAKLLLERLPWLRQHRVLLHPFENTNKDRYFSRTAIGQMPGRTQFYLWLLCEMYARLGPAAVSV
jgi:hypothetical protein